MRASTLHLLALSACISIPAPEVGYYDGATGAAPSISKLEPNDQDGNVGGVVVTLAGSGFGDSAAAVLVQFGDRNAEILSVEDGEITVRSPSGPIGGGDVVVSVGTVNGLATSTFEYQMNDAVVEVDGDGGGQEVGYVLVNNYWESCYGGMSSRLDDEYGGLAFCTTLAYIGTTGIDGTGEALELAYGRLHSPYQGFFGGTDLAGQKWRVERPGEVAYAAGIEDYHVDLGPVRLRNKYWQDEDKSLERCVDLGNVATYRYPGGVDGYPDPETVYGDGVPLMSDPVDGQCEAGTKYELDTMNLCKREQADKLDDYIYAADWPVVENFFQSSARGDDPVEITVDMPEIGINDVKIALPEPVIVYNTEGFVQAFDDETLPGGQDLWSLVALEHCFDDAGDGEDLDDVAFRFEWKVSSLDDSEANPELKYPKVGEDGILGIRTYVRMTITHLSIGWFGGIAYPIRATVTVPDEHDAYLHEDGRQEERRSVLEVPAEVMYQFPTVVAPVAGGLAGGDGLVSGRDSDGYLIMEVQRVTEYTLESDVGPVVFAYVTGDFGFQEWVNPTDDACHDCLDNDEDGYADERDPDCAGGATDELGAGSSECNDGVDNDDDGTTDAADTECTEADGNDESNCNNGLDDDADGYRDEDDADCGRGDNEALADDCVDGQDNDGDGWADGADPDCIDGTEEDGVGRDACNNGDDDDCDDLTDASDPDCVTPESEEASPLPECADGIDNDGDGTIDTDDAGCADRCDGAELE